ncbi:UNVERIFIED_CONTAM: glycosyltransferase [Campylobacter lari]
MQLSIIVPNITNKVDLVNSLSMLKEQNSQDFEAILIITNPTKIMYLIIEEYLEFFGSRLKLIINNKRRSIQNDIVSGFHLVKGKFTTVIFSDNKSRDYFVSELVDATLNYDADVIEYRPRLVNTIR